MTPHDTALETATALLQEAARGSDKALLRLSSACRDLRFERTAGGKLQIMNPTGARTGNRNSRLTTALTIWADANGTGQPFDSSCGFKLPNGAVKSADCAWVVNERWDALSPIEQEEYAPLCPDFVIALRSPSDTLSELQDKLQEFIDNGARLGWLIDPQKRKVHVYRPGAPVEELADPESVSGDPVAPGFVLSLRTIWG